MMQPPAMTPPPAGKHSTADTISAVMCTLLFLGVGGLGALWTMFGMMATDACRPGPDDPCNSTLITAAYVVGWGGMILAAIITLVGIIRAGNRGTPMYVWPLIGLALVVVSVGGWAVLMTNGTTGWN